MFSTVTDESLQTPVSLLVGDRAVPAGTIVAVVVVLHGRLTDMLGQDRGRNLGSICGILCDVGSCVAPS